MAIRTYVEKFDDFLNRWPGEKQFGPYRFLPVFFVVGAAIEFFMIHWRPNGINFYDTYKVKKSKEKALERLKKWREIEELLKK